jgi:hypothetical protein
VIGTVLEATHRNQPVLILAVFNGTPHPKALCLKTNAKLDVIDITELSVSWHYDENKGWLADFDREA